MKLTLFLYSVVVATKCSKVMDSVNQNWMYISDYCPKMEHCPEGSHVLCLHYDPVNVISPNCGNGFNVTVTTEFQEQILGIMNEMRAKIANGEEVGQDDKPLPRGYGITRVKWDNELASSAQIWADRCIVRHDFCRATKRFSKPGQTVGITRFTRLEWRPVKMNAPEMGSGLNQQKVLYSMNNNMKLLYRGKAGVTKEMVNRVPDLDFAKQGILRGYLDIISSTTTHVGCGVSASTNYYGQGLEETDILVSNLEIVCNFAGSSIPGQKVYETDPPKDEGWSVKCGCPPGYIEDEDCLCVETEVPTPLPITTTVTCNADDPKCANGAPMVLLPIITVEDARPDKLYQQQAGNSTQRRSGIFDIPHNHNLGVHFNTMLRENLNVKKTINDRIINKQFSKIGGSRDKDYRNHYFNNEIIPEQRYRRKLRFQDYNYNIPVTTRNYDITNANEEDKTLLSLLNDLQQEINYMKLKGNVKKIVDSKIRTIYDNVNGDSDHLLKSKYSEFIEDVNDNTERKNWITKLKSRDIAPLNFDYGHMFVKTDKPKLRLTKPINSIKFYGSKP